MQSRTSDGVQTIPPEDRQRFSKRALTLQAMLSTGEPSDDVVWRAYSETEKLIAILKFKTGYETPGVFTKLPDAKDTRRLVKNAVELLVASADVLEKGEVVTSIETLRGARNNLRSYLRAKRRLAARPSKGTDSAASR